MRDETLPTTIVAESSCSCCSTVGGSAGSDAAPVVDPVCGMTVDPTTASTTSTRAGQTYYFCAPGCRRAFDEDPARYLSPAR